MLTELRVMLNNRINAVSSNWCSSGNERVARDDKADTNMMAVKC